MQPVELEIGNAKVTIEIEDENAKLPLIWGANSDKDKQQEVDAAISTFCEWMNISAEQTDTLKKNLYDIGQIKTYTAGTAAAAAAVAADANRNTSPQAAQAGRSRRTRSQQAAKQQQSAAGSTGSTQISDFVRLFHSTMLDTEPFAQPYLKTPQRTESALKYMSRWGATKVNINTAPRQVLEAAFMFGGDAPAVADAIIKARQIHPFTDVNDLQKKIYKYADSIRKSSDFITAASNVFSVKITAVSGVAQTSTTAVILMDGKKAQIVAIFAE
jgi:DNA uptake protein ComE-like DNA-binding protein